MNTQKTTPTPTADTPAKARTRTPRRTDTVQTAGKVASQAIEQARQNAQQAYELADKNIYKEHADLLMLIANRIVLARQNRRFEVDSHNAEILRFLLYYFNGCPLAESVFPDRKYKLHKNILLQGPVGTGKTLIMQIFAEYLRLTASPRRFQNLSVTQMVNYYTLHNNLDRFTYNEENSTAFKSDPLNICLNDIGIQTKTYFGMDTKLLTDEFLHARNEIWTQYGRFAHITTNLTVQQLETEYADSFGRLIDRFKTYNIIPLTGESRR